MPQQDRPWTQPLLIVLVRHRAEEAVLAVCKVYSNSGPGGSSGCQYENSCPTDTAS